MDDSGVVLKKVIEGNGAPERMAKASLLQMLRNRLSDEAVAWIDAAAVIEPRAAFFNTLLGGGGGSDGNSHFSDNFMQSLWMVLPDFGDQREKAVLAVGGVPFDSAAALSESLFAIPARGTRIDKLSPVLFDSTRVGGPNQMSGFEANAGSNPWDFILMLEGSLLFAGALGRKLDDDRAPSARFPFLVNSSPVGLGSSYLGESSGREAWLPVWDKPTSLEEIAAIFSEGRIEKHGRIARSGTDAFVALAQHGHSSGIAAFQRIGFFKGRIGGDNYFTAVDQGVFRSRRNQKVDLLKDIDEWLDKLRDTVQRDQCPKAVCSTVVQVEARIADLALNGSPDSLQAVLVSLGLADILPIPCSSWYHHSQATFRRHSCCLFWLSQAEPVRILGAVPKPQDFDASSRFIDAIKDQVGRRYQLLQAGPLPHIAAAVRQITEGFGLVEQPMTKPFGSSGIVLGDVGDDLLEVFKSERR